MYQLDILEVSLEKNAMTKENEKKKLQNKEEKDKKVDIM